MTTDITELALSLKAAAEKATPGEWVYFPKNTSIEYDVGCDESQGSILYVDSGDFTQAQTDRNGEFIALANPANVLALVEALEKALAKNALVAGGIEATAKLHERIAELESIREAAEKMVRCKGRYHSEQNYRALAALFGVTTPDLPPLDSESRTVTVKLTDINEYLAEVHDKTLNRALRLLAEGVRAGDVAAMRAAGIKVEVE